MNQQSGELRASGGVISTYFASASKDAVNLGSGPAHISADSLSGSTSSGHVIYEGHARLWQGQSVLEAERIELWRDEKKMQATGHVVAIFPQAPGSGPSFGPASTKVPDSCCLPGPTLWQIRAPVLTYWGTRESPLGRWRNRRVRPGFARIANSGCLPDANPGHWDATPSILRRSRAARLSNRPARVGRQLSRVLAQGKVVRPPRRPPGHRRPGGIHRRGRKIRAFRRPTHAHRCFKRHNHGAFVDLLCGE